MYPPFVQAGDQFFKKILPLFVPLQVMYRELKKAVRSMINVLDVLDGII